MSKPYAAKVVACVTRGARLLVFRHTEFHEAGPLAVLFEAVSFGYLDEERVLKQITFELAPGRVQGLLGRTGSGKTTLARLLLRLYDPSSGRISLRGTDIRDAKLG